MSCNAPVTYSVSKQGSSLGIIFTNPNENNPVTIIFIDQGTTLSPITLAPLTDSSFIPLTVQEIKDLCWAVECGDELLIRKCGQIIGFQLTPELIAFSDLRTNLLGDQYYIKSNYQFVTPNGTVIANLITNNEPSTSDYVRPVDNGITSNLAVVTPNPNSADIWGVDNQTPFAQAGFTTQPVDWVMDFGITLNNTIDTSIGTCNSTNLRSQICLEDVDNGSIISGINVPWTSEFQNNPTGSGTYVEDPAGTFTFGAQQNYVLCWEDTNASSQVILNYRQAIGDGFLISTSVILDLAVEYYCNSDGDIVEANFFDGPVDPSLWSSIVEQ